MQINHTSIKCYTNIKNKSHYLIKILTKIINWSGVNGFCKWIHNIITILKKSLKTQRYTIKIH